MSYLNQEKKWLLEEKYQGKKTKKYYQDIKKIEEGEPIDYVIGFVDFLGSKIDLSLHPLIPRLETEYWVEKAIQHIKKQSNSQSLLILDIFSGSGCIGISLLRHIKNAKVDFSDNNPTALRQIKINIQINKISKKKYSIVKSNIFSQITKKYDYIFANPPYVDARKKNHLPLSVKKFEPLNSIVAKDNGLFYIKIFLSQARRYLKKKGEIYLEFDSPQKKSIQNLLQKYNYKQYKFYKDQYNKWRWVKVQS